NRNLPEKASTFYTWVLLTFNEMYDINLQLTDMLTPANAQKVGQALAAGNPLTAELSDNPVSFSLLNLFKESLLRPTQPSSKHLVTTMSMTGALRHLLCCSMRPAMISYRL